MRKCEARLATSSRATLGSSWGQRLREPFDVRQRTNDEFVLCKLHRIGCLRWRCRLRCETPRSPSESVDHRLRFTGGRRLQFGSGPPKCDDRSRRNAKELLDDLCERIALAVSFEIIVLDLLHRLGRAARRNSGHRSATDSATRRGARGR